MIELVVGCPVNNRAWIMPSWFKHVSVAILKAGLSLEHVQFLFVCDNDDDSLHSLANSPYQIERIEVDEKPIPIRTTITEAGWNPDRFQYMVDLRNQLLERVRAYAPFWFWSLDSDMLPDENAFRATTAALGAFRSGSPFGAVGMCTYMSPPIIPIGAAATRWEVGRDFASKATLINGALMERLHREAETLHEVDVIMGSKLMHPLAYHTDYEFHPEGEDVGWSIAAKKQGVRLGWEPNALCKHVITPDLLHRVDPRVGF